MGSVQAYDHAYGGVPSNGTYIECQGYIIQIDALSQLLIEKGVIITENEFDVKLKQVKLIIRVGNKHNGILVLLRILLLLTGKGLWLPKPGSYLYC